MKMFDIASLQSRVKLSDGYDMPILGFGVYEMNDEETYKSVSYALEVGYRHIDSAKWYENEEECGRAIRDFLARSPHVRREDIFFTTKLKHNEGYLVSKKAIEASVKACGLEYIDLYLIHGPPGGPEMRKQSWEACVEAQNAGLVRSIGVSNYGVRHLREMISYGLPLPCVNQVDLHPFQTRTDIVKLCQERDIVLQAWAPLVRAMRFDHPVLKRIAQTRSRTVAQVLIRYSLQKGYVPLPKSVNQDRIKSNSQVFDFEITQSEIEELDGLDEGLVTDWEVTDCP